MRFNLLGTGGVTPIPKPCCNCKLCQNARKSGLINYQTGPSFYVYDDNLLFDTPEEVRFQLNRENIEKVENIILTHWHPDHTQGIRIIEQINMNHIKHKPEDKPINVYISKKQLDMFKKYGAGNFLDFYENKGLIKLLFLENEKPIVFNNVTVIPVYIKRTEGYYFIIKDNKTGTKLVYAPCEYHELKVFDFVKDIDVFISHCLYFENKEIGSGVDYSSTEDSFEKMLKDSKEMEAKKIIITHTEEAFQLTMDELNDAAKKYYSDYNIKFVNDGYKFEV
ncbi:MAG: MBL fold metallo-hydrolase [Clostridia bacterium]|nr:MBL fold metallo-hydrolase [Clostridia bacterium]